MEAAVAKASAPEEPAPLSGDGGGQVQDGVADQQPPPPKRRRCNKGLPIIDGDVCPDLGLMFEEGEEEAAMVEDEVQDVE